MLRCSIALRLLRCSSSYGAIPIMHQTTPRPMSNESVRIRRRAGSLVGISLAYRALPAEPRLAFALSFRVF